MKTYRNYLTWTLLMLMPGCLLSADDAPQQLVAYAAILKGQLLTLDAATDGATGTAAENYMRSVLELSVTVQLAGDLDHTILLQQEIKRLETDPGLPGELSTFHDLKKLQLRYKIRLAELDQEKAGRTSQLFRQFDAALARIQADWVRKGEIAQAEAIRDARKEWTDKAANRQSVETAEPEGTGIAVAEAPEQPAVTAPMPPIAQDAGPLLPPELPKAEALERALVGNRYGLNENGIRGWAFDFRPEGKVTEYLHGKKLSKPVTWWVRGGAIHVEKAGHWRHLLRLVDPNTLQLYRDGKPSAKLTRF